MTHCLMPSFTPRFAAWRGKTWRKKLAQSRGSVNDRADGLVGGIADGAACSFAS